MEIPQRLEFEFAQLMGKEHTIVNCISSKYIFKDGKFENQTSAVVLANEHKG